MFHVYILHCSDASFYVGSCSNLSTRLAAHHRGEAAAWTAARRPVELVHSEAFATREEALLRERQIKGWTHAKKAALAAGDTARLRSLARSGESPQAAVLEDPRRIMGELAPSPTSAAPPSSPSS